MVYGIAAIPMILNDLEGRYLIASYFK